MDALQATVKHEFRFFVYHGISAKLDLAIAQKDRSELELLKQMVEDYCENYVISGSLLQRKLKMLEN
ncbi:MAG: hypothetical protein N4A64_11175 [Marinisporobacter sp.]|jgi:hypothetical protein|nr:hypothetical protein [Marinisporobacter sp.]